MTAFVGAERHALVNDLVERFEWVCNGGGVQVVTLVSPPGWGKTRIIQELYERLAADQPEPHYWPSTLRPPDTTEMESVLEGRKQVFPRVVEVPRGAVMPWMWWGVMCAERGYRSYAQAWADNATQIWAHADGIISSTTDRAGRAFDATDAVVGFAGLAGVALAPPIGAALTVGGGIRVIWQNSDLIERLRRWRQRRDERRVDTIGHGREDQIAQVAAHLDQMAGRAPVIIAIDDAHDADPTLVRLLDHLVSSRPGAPIMVVASAWTQTLRPGPDARPYTKWLDDLESERVARIDLKPLEDSEAADLVAAEVSDLTTRGAVSPTVTEALLARTGSNPLGVRTVLRLPDLKQALLKENPDLATLERLPLDLRKILTKYFDGLPPAVQEVLARAAELGQTYLPEVVIAAARSDGVIEAATAAREAVSPYGWCRSLEEALHSFVDPLLVEAAQSSDKKRITQEERKKVHQELIQAAQDQPDCGPENRSAEIVWQQHVNLAREGLVPADDAAAQSGFRLAELKAGRYNYAEAIALTTECLDWAERSGV